LLNRLATALHYLVRLFILSYSEGAVVGASLYQCQYNSCRLQNAPRPDM